MRCSVLLDLDDTILDFQKAEKAAVTETLKQMNAPHDEQTAALYSRINDSQWKRLEKGEITREQLLPHRFELLYEALGIERSATDTQKIYETRLSQGHYFIEGAVEMLETLCKDYDLYIISNGTAHVQDGRIASAGIDKYFKDIFISQRVGVNKPAKEFFDRCFARMPQGVKERAIVVGDSLSSDIQGGRNAGVLTCWFNPHGKPKNADIPADYEIRSLAELPALLLKIF